MSDGVRIRPYGPADAQAVAAVRAALADAEGPVWRPVPEPGRSLVARLHGRTVGYTYLCRWTEADATRLYLLLGWVLPAFRRRGIGTALLAGQERQAVALDAGRTPPGVAMFGGNAEPDQPDVRALLVGHGYRVAFTVVELAATPTPQPPVVLPPGVALRPVEPQQHERIHAAIESSFADSRHGHTPRQLDEYLRDEVTGADLDLWQVAWAGEQVAGVVIGRTHPDRPATVPWVAVPPGWRRRGVASALLRAELQAMAHRGVPEVRISTVAENPHRTVALYQRTGFQVVDHHPRYRKPLDSPLG